MLALQVQWTKFGSQNRMKARCRQETSVTLLGGEKLRKRIPEPQVPEPREDICAAGGSAGEVGLPKSTEVQVPQAPDVGYGADLSFHSSFLEQEGALLATACWKTKKRLHLWGCEEATVSLPWSPQLTFKPSLLLCKEAQKLGCSG